jgi:hypothetical protein
LDFGIICGKRGVNMVRVSKWGAVSISIMSLSSILGTSNESGFSIGDKLFNVLGFPSWSHGYTGTHYTALFSIFLFLIGAIVAGKAFVVRGWLL